METSLKRSQQHALRLYEAWEDAEHITNNYYNAKVSYSSLARLYKVSPATIKTIIKRYKLHCKQKK